MKKVFFGTIVSALFLYFSLSGVDFLDIKKSFADVNYFFLLQALFFFTAILFLKSIRWGIILSSIKQVSQANLFPITCVGNMAVILFPFRLGEFVKPYLISNSNSIPLSASLSTVFVERVLDSLCILAIVVYTFITLDIPEWFIKAGYSFAVTSFIISLTGFFFYLNTRLRFKILNPLVKIISEKLYKKVEVFFYDFSQGFLIISNLRKTVLTIFLSVLIWLFATLAIYSLYYFQGLHLSFGSAFVVLAIIAIGVSVPTAPGFLGNFQFACILALSLFNISKADAIAFSIIYYILGFGINILLGLVFIPFTNFSFKNMRHQLSFKNKTL